MKKLNLCLLLLVVYQFVLAQKSLKFNLEIGKIYTQQFHSEFNMEQDMMDIHVSSNVDVTQNIDFKVQNFENDLYTLEATIEKFVMNTKAQGIDIKMDATGDLNNPVNKVMSNMIHKPFIVQMTSKGEVKDVSGLSEIIQSITDGIDIPETQKISLKKAIASKIDKTTLSQQLNIAGFKYPEQAIKVGDSWTGEFGSNKDLNINYKSTYTLKEINKDYIICDFKAVTTPSDNENTPKGNLDGHIKLDSKSGWILDSKGTQALKGNFTIKNPMDEQADDIQFFMEMKGGFDTIGGSK